MALMDEFKEEREAVLLHGTLKQKISYFFHYYKWHTLIVIFVTFFTVNYIYSLVTRPEQLLYGITLNTFNEDASTNGEKLIQDFAKKYNIDTSDYSLILDTDLHYLTTVTSDISSSNYDAMQVMSTRSATGELDFITGDLDSLVSLGYNEFFNNLREVLSPEQYELFEPYMLYIDEKLVSELNELPWGEDIPNINIPNPREPETMEKPIPILIDVTKSEKLNTVYNLEFDTLVLGIVNATNPETTIQFIEYLMQ